MISYLLADKYPGLTVFTTTRNGGHSKNTYESFNLSPFSGDEPENFDQNFRLLSDQIKIPTDRIVVPYQTHETEIRIIDSNFLKLQQIQKDTFLYGVDALVTAEMNLCIGVTTADCVPVFFYDNIQKVIAVAHAGWRGTCAGIVTKVIDVMKNQFGCNVSDIYAAIGPSISSEVYNVGAELYDTFAENGFPVEMIFQRKQNELYLDLWQANVHLLVQSGIQSDRIEISGKCTYTDHHTFYSARRLGIRSGRMYSGIALKA